MKNEKAFLKNIHTFDDEDAYYERLHKSKLKAPKKDKRNQDDTTSDKPIKKFKK